MMDPILRFVADHLICTLADPPASSFIRSGPVNGSIDVNWTCSTVISLSFFQKKENRNWHRLFSLVVAAAIDFFDVSAIRWRGTEQEMAILLSASFHNRKEMATKCCGLTYKPLNDWLLNKVVSSAFTHWRITPRPPSIAATSNSAHFIFANRSVSFRPDDRDDVISFFLSQNTGPIVLRLVPGARFVQVLETGFLHQIRP